MSEGLTPSQLAEKNALLVTENAALQQKLDAVTAENARMLSDYRDIPEMRRIGAPLTPATDAILNEVRAEGVEYVAKHMDSLQHNLMVSSTSLREYAAQLRTGSTEGGV